MKSIAIKMCCAINLLLGCVAGHSATVNWSASIDNGFSLTSGTELPSGNLVRVGYFRDPATQTQLTDAQIQALAGTPALLDTRFVQVASSSIGSGLQGMASHFTATNAVDTAAAGLVGKQIYLWVLNAATLGEATEQAILYWDINDLTNPDASPVRPGLRWAFPVEAPIPGTTSLDVTDLTIGSTTLGTGARLVIGSFPLGASSNTTAPNFGLAIISNVLNINTTSPLATAVRNAPYSQTLVATGETEDPLVWSVNSGSLPPGLELNGASGTLSGTPTTNGNYTFTVQVTSGGLIAAKQFNLVVSNSALVILTSDLEDLLVDRPYATMLNADGGIAPFTWIRTTGTLPPGIILETDGRLRGITDAPGSYTFGVSVSDQSGQVQERAYTMVATYNPTIEGNSVMPSGVRNRVYNRQFTIPDGRIYNWSITDGAMPPGMTLNVAGRLRGASPQAGTYSFMITASAEGGITTSRQFTLTILPTNSAPSIETPDFPDTVVGRNGFRYQIVASPLPATVFVDDLPPGLKVDPRTGWVTGNATTPGVYVTAIRASNAAGSSPVVYATIRVSALPTGAVGRFNAIVGLDQNANGLQGGRLDVTTTVRGGFSMVLTQGSVVLRRNGMLTTPEGSLSPQIVERIGNRQFNLVFDSHNESLVGTISTIAANGTLSPANVVGWRQTWTLTNPSSAQDGYYSASINLTNNFLVETVPQGAGFTTIKVGTSGLVIFAGRTASGGLMTCTSLLSHDNRLLLYSRQNGNLGVIQGILNLTTGVGGVSANTLSGGLTWRKSTSPTTVYPSAFGPLSLAVEGGYMSRNIADDQRKVIHVIGLPEDNVPSALSFTGGGLEGASQNPNVGNFSFTSAYSIPAKAYLTTPSIPTVLTQNPTRTALSIVTSTGLVSGKFELLDGRVRRLANYRGVIVRTASGELKAEGYFLLPKIRQFGETRLPEILSGKFQLTQPTVQP